VTRKPTQPHPGQAKRLFAEAYDAAAGLSSSLPRALGALANEASGRHGLASPSG
jgi:hypothetical protein